MTPLDVGQSESWPRRLIDRLRGRRSAAPGPLTEAERRAQWIACVVDMCDREAEKPDPDYTAMHWIFLRKVLGFTSEEAVPAHRLRDRRLTREECERLARDWWRCEVCGEPVAHSAAATCPTHTTTEAAA